MAHVAYDMGDIEASRKAHEATHLAAPEEHSKVGERLKSIVYGGLDGIITTFAVVAGATGGHLETDTILILGISSLFADACSMGVGAALSTKAEDEMVLREREREVWEMRHSPESEKQEMVDIYVRRGLAEPHARVVVERMATNHDFFVDQMVTDELGLSLPDGNPWVEGAVTAGSFVAFGVFPLLAYLCLSRTDWSDDLLFVTSCGLTALMLFVLGVVKSQFTMQAWWVAGIEILALGGLTAAVSYGVGALVAEAT